ncbi:MAG TPA: hypothetical protein VJB94_03015 [Candidatus Nanoarchaeia archaeon]|nr:hypothetical protein [Candidatus Nanoarchaeia archaeon]
MADELKKVRLYVIDREDTDHLKATIDENDIIFTDEENKVLSTSHLGTTEAGWEYLIAGKDLDNLVKNLFSEEAFKKDLIPLGSYVGVALHPNYPHAQVPSVQRRGILQHVEFKPYEEFQEFKAKLYEIKDRYLKEKHDLVNNFAKGMSKLGGFSLETLLFFKVREN